MSWLASLAFACSFWPQLGLKWPWKPMGTSLHHSLGCYPDTSSFPYGMNANWGQTNRQFTHVTLNNHMYFYERKGEWRKAVKLMHFILGPLWWVLPYSKYKLHIWLASSESIVHCSWQEWLGCGDAWTITLQHQQHGGGNTPPTNGSF